MKAHNQKRDQDHEMQQGYWSMRERAHYFRWQTYAAYTDMQLSSRFLAWKVSINCMQTQRPNKTLPVPVLVSVYNPITYAKVSQAISQPLSNSS